MLKRYCKYLICLSFGLFSVYTAAAAVIDPALAVGHYFTETLTNEFPLLAHSSDGGISWDYTINSSTPALPTGSVGGCLLSASCSALNCVTVGYSMNGTTNFPLLANSIDGGATWTYAIKETFPALPSNFQNGKFFSVSCSELNCVALGAFRSFTLNDFDQVLLANSSDGGVNWKYTMDDINFFPSETPHSRLFSAVSCSGSNCVAVGEADKTPLIISSNNGGQSWKETLHTNAPNLPANFTGGNFYATSCSGLDCIAVGNYGTDTITFGFPLLAHSKDGGATWAYTMTATTPTLPTGFIWGRFMSASCSGIHCVVGGYYYGSGLNMRPLLATSHDGGASWVYSLDTHNLITTANDITFGITSGQFSSVSCSGLNCIASGSYISELSYPLVAHSSDGGTTWVYVIHGSSPSLPTGFGGGQLVTASCKDLHCIAAGEYFVDNAVFPLLASSVDGGFTWTYRITRSTPTLPSNAVEASFSSVEKSASPYLPSSLEFLN